MRSHNWLISHEIQDGGGRHIENQTFGHKSAIIAYICTEFDAEAEKSKIQDDGGAILKSVKRP